jgi:phosphatidate cytidylyltransferase
MAAVLGLAVLSGLMVRYGDTPKSGWSYLGIFYVAFPGMALVVLRQDAVYGFGAILWVFLIVWAADILAYFSGRIVGGPRLAPRISPKKTWAGLAGAIIGSAFASFLVGHFMGLGRVWPLAVLAGALAIVEQAGDLFESLLKRHHGVKDSGRLIPGHGGVIDRVDGLIFVAVVAALVGFCRGQGLSAAQGLLLW